MTLQAFSASHEHGHLLGDIPALAIVAVALAALIPRGAAVKVATPVLRRLIARGKGFTRLSLFSLAGFNLSIASSLLEKSMAVANLTEGDINWLIDGFFRLASSPPLCLEQVRIRVLQDDERLALPPDSVRAIVGGLVDLPDVAHMASFTYLDILVFQEQVAERRLFHALVHASQFALLGLRQYLQLYIRAFLADWQLRNCSPRSSGVRP